MTVAEFRRWLLALPGVVEKPHFDRTKFRRRIDFASLHEVTRTTNLKLSLALQAEFSSASVGTIYPVPNGFGRMGWTTVELDNVDGDLLWAGVLAAWEGAG